MIPDRPSGPIAGRPGTVRPDTSRGSRVLVLVLTAAAVGAATSPVFAFGVLAPTLVEDLGLSRAQVGFLPTALYLTATLTSSIAGRITDALGGRRVAVGLGAVVMASYLLVAASPGLAVMVAGAALGGLALASANPATNLILARTLPRSAVSAAMGWKQAGVPLASTVAGVLLPVVAVAGGWRAAFLAGAAMALAYLLLSATLLPPVGPVDAGAAHGAGGTDALRWLCTFALFMGGAGGVANTHYALFATSEVGMGRARAGAAIATMGLVGAVSRVGWARIADGPVGSAPRVLAVLGVLGVLATGVLAASPALGPWAFWCGALASGTSLYAWNSVLNLVVVTTVALPQVGAASGQVMRFFYLGLLSTPVAFGLSVDATSSYALGWVGQATLLAAAALVAGCHSRRLTSARYRARTSNQGGLDHDAR